MVGALSSAAAERRTAAAAAEPRSEPDSWRARLDRRRNGAGNGDLRKHLDDAHKLLCSANRKGVRIPRDVITVLVEIRRTYEEGRKPEADEETRFWNAYGLLRSAIEPTHRARRMYRWVFYITLALLLLCQLTYLFGASVRDQITRLDEEYYLLLGQQQAAIAESSGADQAAAAAPAGVDILEERIQTNRAMRQDYGQLAWQLVPWLSNGNVALAGLKIYLEFLSSYLLPALYGLLGACAFVLRQLSDDIGKLRFASDIKGQYTLRLNIGMLAGLAVGWFIQPDQEASVVANLPPLALAFVAGYGSDLLFAVLDRIVQAFTSPQSDGTTLREESAGGLERIEERRVETRVADGRRADDGRRPERAGPGAEDDPAAEGDLERPSRAA